MISHHDLIYHPERYKPLRSVKSINNVENPVDFSYVDLEEKFLSENNTVQLCKNLYTTFRHNGGRSAEGKFNRLIPLLMKKFAKTHALNQYQSALDDTFGFQNWTDELAAINLDFCKMVYGKFKWNQFVPTREWAEVGDSENKKQVRFTDLQAEDYPTLNVWKSTEINIKNSQNRDNNQIPVWRASIHKRNYERDDSGSGYKYDVASSSKENLQRGFDMTNVYNLIDHWQSENYFGL